MPEPSTTVEKPAAVEPPHASEEFPHEELEPDPLVLEELLVEDVSIDGMCGVY